MARSRLARAIVDERSVRACVPQSAPSGHDYSPPSSQLKVVAGMTEIVDVDAHQRGTIKSTPHTDVKFVRNGVAPLDPTNTRPSVRARLGIDIEMT
jgi:hypothetical protein